MKRSRRIVLMMMGAAVVGSTAATEAFAQFCDPGDPRFFFPDGTPRRRDCVIQPGMRQGGFGGSSFRIRHRLSGGG